MSRIQDTRFPTPGIQYGTCGGSFVSVLGLLVERAALVLLATNVKVHIRAANKTAMAMALDCGPVVKLITSMVCRTLSLRLSSHFCAFWLEISVEMDEAAEYLLPDVVSETDDRVAPDCISKS